MCFVVRDTESKRKQGCSKGGQKRGRNAETGRKWRERRERRDI